ASAPLTNVTVCGEAQQSVSAPLEGSTDCPVRSQLLAPLGVKVRLTLTARPSVSYTVMELGTGAVAPAGRLPPTVMRSLSLGLATELDGTVRLPKVPLGVTTPLTAA